MASVVNPRRSVQKSGDELYLLHVDKFQRMVDSEILPPDRCIYLWAGKLFEKMGKNPPHAITQTYFPHISG